MREPDFPVDRELHACRNDVMTPTLLGAKKMLRKYQRQEIFGISYNLLMH